MSPIPKPSFYGGAFFVTLFLHAASIPHITRANEPKLVLSLKIPPNVKDIDDFIITGTLKNAGSQDVKVVKDPSGLLWDLFSPPVFNIEKADSKSNIKNPTFVGGIAKWSLEKYLTDQGKSDSSVPKIPDEYSESSKTKKRGSGSDDSSDEQGTTNSGSSHTSVEDLAERLDSLKLDAPPPAGTTIDLRQKASIKIEYKVWDAYDFTDSGPGKYNIKLRRNSFWTIVDNVVLRLPVVVESSTVEIDGKLVGSLVKPDDKKGTVDKRDTSITTLECSPLEAEVIEAAARVADRYLADSKSHLKDIQDGTETTERYEYWFGDKDTELVVPYRRTPWQSVNLIYKSMRLFSEPARYNGYTYDCSCDMEIVAWVHLGRIANPVIHLCNHFRSERLLLTGPDSTAGALVHEGTHFGNRGGLSATDSVYGEEACHATAMEDAYWATGNADNYQFFSEYGYTLPLPT